MDSDSGAGFLQGDIAEILVYNRALSILEQSQVETYLGKKYGLQISNNAYEYFQGLIDEFRIFDRLLSVQEVQDDMNSAYPIDRTVASYSFEKVQGSQALDTHNVVKGRFGAAIRFDGNNVDAGNIANFAPTSPIVVSLWAFRTSSNSQMHILGKRNGCGVGGINYQLVSSSGSLSFGGDTGINTGIDLPVNTWTHLTASFDGARFRFYINGGMVGQAVDGALGPSNIASFLIGNSGSCPTTQSFQGFLDEVRILNVAVS